MSGSKVINTILEKEGIKPGTFAKVIGVTPAQIYDLQSGKIQKVSSKVAEKILNVYPQYTYSWLVSGEGEMLKTTEVKPKTIVGKVGTALGESVAEMTLGASIAAAAATPSLGFGGIIGALFGGLFDSKEDITEEEAVDVLKEALEDAKKTTQENEELKQEVEYWRQKANNLEYQLSKTKAG